MKKLFLLWGLLLALPAQAALSVFACEPEWAALASEIGGDKIAAYSATTAKQDVHHLEARPSLIAKIRNADLLVCTGLELEAGWLPVLLQQSGNPKIQPGQIGHLEAGMRVNRLEIPKLLDRSQGDIHAGGNPHIQLDPRNIARVAEALTTRLVQIDPSNASHYQSRHTAFAARWHSAQAGWEKQAAPLRGMAVVTHHKDMVYLANWLGLKEIGQLEPKPGVAPSSAHLAGLLERLRQTPAKAILRTPYQDVRASQWLADKSGARAIELPFTVGGDARDLFALFDLTVQRLLEAAR